MMIPRDILLDANGDLDVSKGLRLTPTLAIFVKQRINQRIQFFLGEWFLDKRRGVPYFERVFVSNPDLPLLTSLYRRIVLGTTGVAGLDKPVALTFTRRTRVLGVSFVARCLDSSLVVFKDTPFVLEQGSTL